MNVIEQLNNEQIQALGKNVPDFSPGDTLVPSGKKMIHLP